MEVAYIESDPKSAPHAVVAPEREPPSDPPYLFVPNPNDKYPVYEDHSQGLGTGLGTGPAYVPPDLEQERPHIPIWKKKWPWFLGAGLLAIAIIVAGVVGGVVGSRNAQSNSNNQSDDSASAMSPTPTSATSTTSPASTTTSSKTESASSTSTEDVTTVEMYANDPCSGTLHTWDLKPGSSGCRVVDGDKRSILIRSNQGCNVTTWSSATCNGLNYKVQNSACHNVLYAAVSYSC